jgi:hypothetical protein
MPEGSQPLFRPSSSPATLPLPERAPLRSPAPLSLLPRHRAGGAGSPEPARAALMDIPVLVLRGVPRCTAKPKKSPRPLLSPVQNFPALFCPPYSQSPAILTNLLMLLVPPNQKNFSEQAPQNSLRLFQPRRGAEPFSESFPIFPPTAAPLRWDGAEPVPVLNRCKKTPEDPALPT